MSDDPYLDGLEETLGNLQAEVAGVMRLVNRRLQENGGPARFDESAIAAASGTHTVGAAGLREDAFHGMRLGTAIPVYLEARKTPAKVNDIYNALIHGSYEFGGKSERNNKQQVRSAVGKTPFHTLRKGVYGLEAWYDHAKKSRSARNGASENNGDDESR